MKSKNKQRHQQVEPARMAAATLPDGKVVRIQVIGMSKVMWPAQYVDMAGWCDDGIYRGLTLPIEKVEFLGVAA